MTKPLASEAPIRILYVSDTGAQLGGAERSLLALLERLDPARYERHVVLAEEGRFANLLRQANIGVEFLRLGAIERTRNPLRLAIFAVRLAWGVLRLWRLMRRRRIQIVHVNKNPLALHAIPAAWLAGAACLWHVRNPVQRFGRIGAWLVRNCKALVCVSESIAEPFRQAFPQAAAKLSIVPEGIDPAPYANREAGVAFRRELGLPPEAPVIGTVGRITRWKGQDDFLRAAALVAVRRPDAQFLVVGDCVSSPAEAPADQAFRRRLHALADELGIAERVIFTGFREDTPAVMNALDVFVLPSHSEPFGIVLLEAMAAQRPIVATAAGGVPDILRDGQEALLVPPCDPAAMAAAIERLLDDKALASALAAAAAARVAAQFPLWRSPALLREIYVAML